MAAAACMAACPNIAAGTPYAYAYKALLDKLNKAGELIYIAILPRQCHYVLTSDKMMQSTNRPGDTIYIHLKCHLK